MNFKELDYQQRTLAALDAYLEELKRQKAKVDEIAEDMRELIAKRPEMKSAIPDFTAETWAGMGKPEWTGPRLPASRHGIPFSPRKDGTRRPVPNITLKIPTSGGKTFLAVSGLFRVFNSYLGRNTGFVLWIVPNEAIYTQTKKALKNREHPYRQMLDRTAAGRVKIMEKDDRLDVRDVEANLCVMLLMLQSANRETKDSLKVFKDRGNIHGFFPVETDFEAHREMLRLVPNLDPYKDANDADSFQPIIKDSLGNALRIIRPVVVLDEGHKAISTLAFKTLYGFNPCFVLELSATPKDRQGKDGEPPIYANVLVEVQGTELEREGMIKMPLNLEVKPGPDWRDCLKSAVERLTSLEAESKRYNADSGRYIRPILLVQVERTGRDQADAGFIHANEAKAFLIQAGFAETEIALKTAETDELKGADNQDLLSPACPVRAIITKQALQEGWDCPFAYVLCALSASGNLTAMTQLIGRILRQPEATKTEVAALDECYVYCHHPRTGEVVEAIKSGLESDGMGDLVQKVLISGEGSGTTSKTSRKVHRRPKFKDLEIFLPLVLRVDGERARPLDYEQDILSGLDWSAISLTSLAATLPEQVNPAEAQLRRIHLREGTDGQRIVDEDAGRTLENLTFDPVFAARIVGDILPNPWHARSAVEDLLQRLRARGFDEDRLGALSSLILEELRKTLGKERDRLAEGFFKAEVAAGRIQFRLRMDWPHYKMPASLQTDRAEGSDLLIKNSGLPLDKSLFTPMYRDDFNQEESSCACYLDEERTLQWWHRNVAMRGFHVQGWRKHRVYPDFIFVMPRGAGAEKVFVIETKGDQLEGNLDTEYKKKLLKMLTEAYQQDKVQRAGKMTFKAGKAVEVVCELVMLSDFKVRMPRLFEL